MSFQLFDLIKVLVFMVSLICTLAYIGGRWIDRDITSNSPKAKRDAATAASVGMILGWTLFYWMHL